MQKKNRVITLDALDNLRYILRFGLPNLLSLND